MKTLHRALSIALVALFIVGCGTDDVPEPELEVDRPVDENGKATFFPTEDAEVRPGKDDDVRAQRGLAVDVDREATSVWEVRNAWEDTDTPAAREAGMAWPENSGLNWDEKYRAWVAAMEQTQTAGSSFSRQTFVMTTPWGKTLDAPALECAEVAIFLRIAFASWYNLPFFMEARDAEGRIYFGHFGMRRDNGNFGRMPNFRDRYPDYSSRADEVRAGARWPSDPELAELKIPGSFDDQQPMLGEGKHAGAYFDEVFLNKRVGYFLRLTLAWFGSINLADSANTYNLVPQATEAGDVLVERWQSSGIGHTLVVMRSEQVGETVYDGRNVPQLEVEMASGSMPRRQPVWESSGASKRHFANSSTGGPGNEAYGGGIKRWRSATNVGGRWTNVILSDDVPSWIDSTDHDAISERLEIFESILVELSPDQKRDVLLDVIESKRQHLQQFPASCAARIAREDAFESLYELMAEEFGMTESEVDEEYRRLADYAFARLVYDQSKTCCWNRSTNAMYDIVMDLNVKAQEQADMCVAPIVFMNRDDAGDGYELFRQHAVELGRGDQWVDWSADESCPQQGVAEDTIADSNVVPYCELSNTEPEEPIGGGDSDTIAVEFQGAEIPDNDPRGVELTSTADISGSITGATLDVDISHTWRGDLSIEIVHPDGTRVMVKSQDGDSGDDVNERYEVPGFFGKSASGEYRVVVVDHASLDEGRVNSMTLNLSVAQ